jgi:hypothetical protein
LSNRIGIPIEPSDAKVVVRQNFSWLQVVFFFVWSIVFVGLATMAIAVGSI